MINGFKLIYSDTVNGVLRFIYKKGKKKKYFAYLPNGPYKSMMKSIEERLKLGL